MAGRYECEEGIVRPRLVPDARVLIIGGVFPGQGRGGHSVSTHSGRLGNLAARRTVSAARAAGSQQGSGAHPS